MVSSSANKSNDLDVPVQYLKGVGPRRARIFEKCGISTIRDLLYYMPRHYEDRSTFIPLANVVPGTVVTVQGTVLAKGLRRLKGLTLFEVMIEDESGRIQCTWFNQPYLAKQFSVGASVIMTGKVELYRKKLQIVAPDHEIIDNEQEDTVHTGRIVPVYPLTEGLYQRSLRVTMKRLVDTYVEAVEETLPADILSAYSFLSKHEALREIHFPSAREKAQEARRRLVFEEFYNFEKEIARKIKLRERFTNQFKVPYAARNRKTFCAALPFTLTGSQTQAIDDIVNDMSGASVMSRLLQGDVGSGKTLVATCVLYLMAQEGFQGVFLVPTEILAEQHYKTIRALFDTLHVTVVLLTGATSADEKKSIRKGCADGAIKLVVGTHALLQEGITFKDLGLVVIDEQHKFGVEQRAYLMHQERMPHMLVMTATPIPRTLGFILYGDLDHSVLRELPHGPRAVKTYWITEKKQAEIFTFVKKKLDAGDQAYIIFPLIDETEKIDLRAARQEYETLQSGPFRDYALGLIHGKVAKEEKQAIMQRFRTGEIQLLVSTSVVEVGIDNPNAAIIIIAHADRFGLAQLHQMRGRVGRGKKESFCFLFGDPTTETGKRRLRLLTKTNDGFKIAEEDMYLRGPGDFLGTRQSGLPFFRLADIVRDSELLFAAKKEAFREDTK